MPRILAIDYGEKRIGLALSDELKSIAFEFEIWSPQEFYKKITGLIAAKEIEKIIVGYPLNLSGAETQKTREVLAFAEKLRQLLPLIPVEMLDERLSSKMASTLSGRTKNVDALAAQIILQNYLNKN